MSENSGAKSPLSEARDEFVSQWGAIGSAWGINRTMAQIHALLITSITPLSTDEVMAELSISRGNAHGNLRELVNWGLVRSVIRKGERKEFFEAEKEVWKMFSVIINERRRRELKPAMQVLSECAERTKGLRSEEAVAFNRQIRELGDFLSMSDNILSKVAASKESNVIPWALKFLK